jgi:hypothetical protein
VTTYALADLIERSGLTSAAAMRACRVSGAQWNLYEEKGLTLDQADRLACRLGLPAVTIWPSMVDDLIEAHQVECAAPDCPVRFDPQDGSKKPRRYCSRACQLRTNARRRYQEDPQDRERRKASRRRYRAEIKALQEKRRAA